MGKIDTRNDCTLVVFTSAEVAGGNDVLGKGPCYTEYMNI